MSPAKVKRWNNERHAHGCVHCGIRYEDACADSSLDARCTTCRGGRAWDLLIEHNAPGECCATHARIVRKEERDTYHLAGTRIWFICTRCARTSTFDPATSNPYADRKARLDNTERNWTT
jgi:hypothetical protein